MRGEVVQDHMDVEVLGNVAVDLVQERHEVRAGVAGADVGNDLPRRDLEGGEQVAGAVPLIVVGAPGRAGRHIGRVGAVRSSAWIWGFSSIANTAAATGGFMYIPTRSRIFSIKSGSGEALKESCRHGLRPNARQISPTVVCEIPYLAARPRVDQCVASCGAVS